MSNGELYKPIKLSTLLPSTFPGVATFLRNGSQFVLYKSHELPFTAKDKERLLDNGVEYLYIRVGDSYHYNQYVETNLNMLLRNESLPLKERREILATSTINYVSEVFENASNIRTSLGRGAVIIEKLLENLLNLDEAMEILAPLVGHHHYTYIHSVQVATYSLALHQKLYNLRHDEMLDVGIGSLFHDFGKVYVPSEILNKPTKLTPQEFEIMKNHTIEGVGFLKTVTAMSEVALSIVRHHHEKENGFGYPDRLKGNQISRSSKIAAIVDVYSALTTNRAYRLALEKGEAIRIMEEEMAGSFDPYFLNHFKELL